MLQEYFQELTDKRQPWKIKHKLLEIVVMTICAVIAGCDVWEDIVDYCRVKVCWFRESLHMELTNGIPSHNILKQYPAKISLARKRRRCAYDDAFLADILHSVHA